MKGKGAPASMGEKRQGRENGRKEKGKNGEEEKELIILRF